jgi:hypothetical protein
VTIGYLSTRDGEGAVDGFVPLLLTAVDGRSVAVAGIVVTVAVLGWTQHAG